MSGDTREVNEQQALNMMLGFTDFKNIDSDTTDNDLEGLTFFCLVPDGVSATFSSTTVGGDALVSAERMNMVQGRFIRPTVTDGRIRAYYRV